MSIIKELTASLKKLVLDAGYEVENLNLQPSGRKDLGQFQINDAMPLAKKYGKSNAKMMIEKHVSVGWSKEMCKESWGEPNDINVTTGNWGTHEQWVYEYIERMQFLYFENGILTAIQD
jgi:arginyl-tRNA synthetase